MVRDECLKNWKFVERDIEFGTKVGSGYPSGEHTQHARTHARTHARAHTHAHTHTHTHTKSTMIFIVLVKCVAMLPGLEPSCIFFTSIWPPMQLCFFVQYDSRVSNATVALTLDLTHAEMI